MKNTLIGLLLVLLIVSFFPWSRISWGKFELLPSSTITVTGTASSSVDNQIANFSAGFYSVSDNRDQAIDQVNTQIETLIQAVKDFGIPAADIQTQNLSIYQMEEPITIDGRQRSAPGQWRVSNDINVTLRDITQAQALYQVLADSGATNIYGPNFGLDNTDAAELDLTQAAIDNATQKAQAIAESSSRKLGKIINVQEGIVSGQPIFYSGRMMGGGGEAPLSPGSQEIEKSLTVTFAIR